jgi:hypothetical protein
VLELDTLAELITAHQDLSTRGRRAYYGCRARH